MTGLFAQFQPVYASEMITDSVIIFFSVLCIVLRRKRVVI